MIGCLRVRFAIFAAFALLLSPLAFADPSSNTTVCSYSNTNSNALLVFDKGFVAGSTKYSGGCFTVTICPANATAAATTPVVNATAVCQNATQAAASTASCPQANQTGMGCLTGQGCDFAGKICCSGYTCVMGNCVKYNASKACLGLMSNCNGQDQACCPGLMCGLGYCLSQGICIETDNGNDPYVKGVISGDNSDALKLAGFGASASGNQQDFCANSTTLVEYFCGMGKVNKAEVGCEYGCSGGKCNPKNAPEGCTPIGSACKAINAAGDTDCCKGMACKAGYCQPQNATLSGCTETDGGNDPSNFGYLTPKLNTTYADYCLNATALREYYCKSGKDAYNDTLCQYGCAALGHCRKASDVPCYDSDGGVNLSVKGTATGYCPLTGETTVTDYCESNYYLHEYACEDGFIKGDTYIAPNCYDGKKYKNADEVLAAQAATIIIVKNVTLPTAPIVILPTCSDSDGGKNFTVKGIVKASDGKNYTDSCARDSLTLTEYFCNENWSAGSMTTTCSSRGGGCSDGKCKS
jgi:hypothetical protein